MHDDQLKIPKKPIQQDSAALFVSLYIVLLAFFIMLNTMAKYDKQRLQNVVQSVSDAFSISPSVDSVPEIFHDAGTELSVTRFFDELKNMAASTVPVQDMDIYTTGNTMEITMPADFFFLGNEANTRDEANVFLNGMAIVLKRWKEGLRVDAEMVVSTKMNQLSLVANSEAPSLDTRRSAELARRMVTYGMPPKAVVPGLISDGKSNVRISFFVREANLANLKLQAPEDEEHEKEKLPSPSAYETDKVE